MTSEHQVIDPSIRWWGDYDLEPNEAAFWRIGSLSLWLRYRVHEWRLAWVREHDALDPTVIVEVPAAGDVEVPEHAELTRLATSDTSQERRGLRLEPALADRGVVSRPEIPFQLLPDDEVDLYVSTPLWLRVLARERALIDMPLVRPSDTWIGPDTMSGQLAYAARTAMRLDLQKVPVYPGRAVTRVRLINRANDPLVLERLKLPVRNLSIGADTEGRLWTEPLTLERSTSGDLAAVQVEARPRDAAGEIATTITEPRERAKRGGFIQALSSLLG